MAANAAAIATGGTGWSSGTERGSSRCKRRKAGGQLRTTTPASAAAPAIAVAVTSQVPTPANAAGATTATSTTPLASANAWSRIAAATAAAGATPACWARYAAPATDHTFPGMYLPRFASMQMRAAGSHASRCCIATTTRRHASTRSAYDSHTTKKLPNSHKGDTTQ